MSDRHAFSAVLAVDCRATLGEGPVWVAAESALYWVDIKGLRLFRRDAAGAVTEWPTPFRIGGMAPCRGGGFIAGTQHGLAWIDPATGLFEIFDNPEPDRPDNRFNDAKVDRAGRFWSGSMDDSERAASGALYRVDADRPSTPTVTRVDDGYRVTNGPAFSRDGRTMYHTDSGLRTIYAFDLDADGGIANKRVFAQFKGADGYPDGMTVDADDCLWAAFWDGWCVRRLSPAGETLATIEMPVERPTSVAFGGPALDCLFVTSARIGLNDAALERQPHAGGLFVLDPGVTGLADVPFEASHLSQGSRHR